MTNDLMTALFLGCIEGLTEFLPVSSTAHLVVLVEELGFPSPPGHIFEVFIQLGAILAVVVLYYKKLFGTVLTLHSSAVSRRFALNLIIGTVPALIAGFLGRDFIKSHLYNSSVIAITLILGGIFILLFEKRFNTARITTVDDISPKTAFGIGCCQMVALIPGVSRSGATIMGSLALGLARPAAAEFSFFLAIPVMAAAVTFDTLRNLHTIVAYGHFELMAAGFFAAFITAMVVVKFAIGIISRYGFAPFAWYRIVMGLLILLFLVP